jgi:hypothetical protein
MSYRATAVPGATAGRKAVVALGAEVLGAAALGAAALVAAAFGAAALCYILEELRDRRHRSRAPPNLWLIRLLILMLQLAVNLFYNLI